MLHDNGMGGSQIKLSSGLRQCEGVEIGELGEDKQRLLSAILEGSDRIGEVLYSWVSSPEERLLFEGCLCVPLTIESRLRSTSNCITAMLGTIKKSRKSITTVIRDSDYYWPGVQWDSESYIKS